MVLSFFTLLFCWPSAILQIWIVHDKNKNTKIKKSIKIKEIFGIMVKTQYSDTVAHHSWVEARYPENWPRHIS